jgi:hypothetical protein
VRPKLADVTLVAVTSVAIEPTVQAMLASMRQVEFGNVLLLSDEPPPVGTDPSIQWRRIVRLSSRGDYSRFMLRELADHVGTAYALCVQWDGFVLNGAAWDPTFLAYDYIGAVWPHFHDGRDVGNGGFSLRSRKLLEACRQLPFDGEAEDVVIGRKCRSELESSGIRFAPTSVAQRFAYERSAPTGHEFGFHGAYNLVKQISPGVADRLFRSLEFGVLARNERLELLWWALTRGRLGLAGMMLKRLISNLLQRGNNLG